VEPVERAGRLGSVTRSVLGRVPAAGALLTKYLLQPALCRLNSARIPSSTAKNPGDTDRQETSKDWAHQINPIVGEIEQNQVWAK
jgi:hypothetical protein